MKKRSLNIYLNLALFILTAVVIGFALFSSEFSNDDALFKSYGNTNLIDILRCSAEYGNGRFLGNTLVQILVISNKIRTPVQTFLFVGMCGLLFYNTSRTSAQSAALCLALILGVSQIMFSETYIWCSAFCNYVPGILCILLIIAIFKSSSHKAWALPIFIISFCAQLFVEHTSLVNCSVAFCYLYYYHKQKAAPEKMLSLVWFTAAILGLFTMFIIPRIFGQSEWVNEYRHTLLMASDSSVSILPIMSNLAHATDFFFNNVVIILCVSFVFLSCLKLNGIQKTILVSAPIYAAIINFIWPERINWTYQYYLYLPVWVPYILAVAEAIVHDKELRGREKILISLLLSIGTLQIFLVIRSYSPRVGLQSYILFVYALLVLYYENCGRIKERYNTVFNAFSLSALIVTLCIVFSSFFSYRLLSSARRNYIYDRMAEGQSMIFYPAIKNPYAYQNNLSWAYGLLYYYDKPYDIAFVSMDYNSWLESEAAND